MHRVVHRKKKKRGQLGLLLRVVSGDPFAAFQLLRSGKKGKKFEKVHRTEINVHLADIFALMDAMGWERAHVIGHDWGSLAGWAVVDAKPERVLSWLPMAVPHIKAFGTAIRENEEQRQKSGSIDLFRQAGTAEAALSANDFQALRNSYKDTHPADEIEEYIDVLSQPGALTGALNWYRGTSGIHPDRDDGGDWGPVATPTLHFWGNQDMAVGRAATLACREYMTGPYELIELNCGHWIVQEAFEEIVGPIVAHLKQYR